MNLWPTNRRKPRLERRYACKHFDYDASTSSSSSSSSFSSGYGAPMVTRSLEFDDMRSFRVEGGEGEFDLICRSLGLSGPEDFTIPESDWMAMKVRSSSDVFPRSRVQCDAEEDVEEAVVEVEKEVVRCDSGNDLDVGGNVEPWRIRSENGGGGGGLVAPPPGMMSRKIDNGSSTWDLLRGFAPEADERVEQVVREVCGGVESDADEVEEVVVRMESCSVASSYDGDCSSTVTRTSSLMFPNVRFRQIITGWIKGQLLGRGSYGSVYEAMSV